MIVVAPIQEWAIDREQINAHEAIQSWGEKVLVRIAWSPADYAAGTISRCSVCMQGDSDNLRDRYADMYQQPGDSHCQSCYGIGFSDGFRPDSYLMDALVTDAPDDESIERQGYRLARTHNIQLLWEPRVGEGDLVIRVKEWNAAEETVVLEAERYALTAVLPQTVRTGRSYGSADEIVVAQTSGLLMLPPNHPFYEVPV